MLRVCLYTHTPIHAHRERPNSIILACHSNFRLTSSFQHRLIRAYAPSYWCELMGDSDPSLCRKNIRWAHRRYCLFCQIETFFSPRYLIFYLYWWPNIYHDVITLFCGFLGEGSGDIQLTVQGILYSCQAIYFVTCPQQISICHFGRIQAFLANYVASLSLLFRLFKQFGTRN